MNEGCYQIYKSSKELASAIEDGCEDEALNELGVYSRLVNDRFEKKMPEYKERYQKELDTK